MAIINSSGTIITQFNQVFKSPYSATTSTNILGISKSIQGLNDQNRVIAGRKYRCIKRDIYFNDIIAVNMNQIRRKRGSDVFRKSMHSGYDGFNAI